MNQSVTELRAVGGVDQDVSRERDWFSMLNGSEYAANQAVAEIYDAYAVLFLKYLKSRGVSAADADDLVADCFVKLLKQRGKLNQVEHPRAYLWTILKNTLIEYQRKPDTQRVYESLDTVPEAAFCITCQAESYNYFDCVKRAYNEFKLKNVQKTDLLELTVLSGLSAKEVAEILGKSHGAVRQAASLLRRGFSEFVRKVCGVSPEAVLKGEDHG